MPGPHRRTAAVTLAALLAIGCSASSSDDAPSPFAQATPPTPAAEVSVDELAARFGEAVWQVETEGCDWLGSGSAFAVDAHHLVTNYHVIANDTSPRLRSPSGEVRDGRVIGASSTPDVAVIAVTEPLPASLLWAPTDSLQQSERLVVMGYPRPSFSFTVSWGSIVNFQGPGGVREAVLSNAPIDKGNSGGPALRGDGSVAGVVTQMSLDDPAERVAIIFTAATVRATVERALQEPTEVLSFCGFGPDYVPPVPDEYSVPEVPPPPAPATTTVPVPVQPSTTATTPPSTTVPCPNGGVAAAVEELTVTPDTEPGYWVVAARGTVTNESTAPVTIGRLEAVVEADETFTADFLPEVSELQLGEVTGWALSDFRVYSPDEEPAVIVTVSWEWTDDRFASCDRP